jgi:phytoene desaturase
VGGGTHPGSGLPVIYSSARITSDLLLEDLGIGSRPEERAGPTVRPRASEPASAL